MLISQKAQTILLSVLGLLLIPLIAMQFTKEVNWTFFDFFVAGGLLFSLAFSVDYIFQKVQNFHGRYFAKIPNGEIKSNLIVQSVKR